jgi:hydrogenase-4 component F
MAMEIVVIAIFTVFAVGAGSCLLVPNPSHLLKIPVFSSLAAFLLAIPIALRLYQEGTFLVFAPTLVVDPLSIYHLFLVDFVFLISSIYGTGYFRAAIESRRISRRFVARYCMLWQAFQAILLLVLLSNNIGVMWVALEATTLVSAFLILSEHDTLSIEAMWKYLLICSVGIVFAFIGTALTVAAARDMQGSLSPVLFTELTRHPELINPRLMLFAFLFIVVGYGTKAGLSPMHTWLPDAHSQAPTPVSAVFSGVMLNCALFCIMRYLPVTEGALGKSGEAYSILLLFGFLSLIFAAVFIPIQHDVKRFLAYSGVEHMGIIAIGLGLGGFGIFAAMLHTLNHSLSKVLAFFSAGQISEQFGTRDMGRMGAAARQSPLWGGSFFVSILVLIGVAPFAIFMSEFLILKEAFFQGRYVIVGLFLFAALAVFVSALKHAMDVSFGESKSTGGPRPKVRPIDCAIVGTCLVVLLLLGVWIPTPFNALLIKVSSAIQTGIGL